MKELTVPAVLESVERATDFVNELLEAADCPIKTQTQIDIALDELLSNIAYYAYAPGKGEAVVGVEIEDGVVTITLTDWGKPYNPLTTKEPDVTASMEDRKVGGLGVFLVRKLMDRVDYAYEDGKNVLRVQKRL